MSVFSGLLDFVFGYSELEWWYDIGTVERSIVIPRRPDQNHPSIHRLSVDVKIDVFKRPRLPWFRRLIVQTYTHAIDPIPQPHDPVYGMAAMTQWWDDVDQAELTDGIVTTCDVARRAADSFRDAIVARLPKT